MSIPTDQIPAVTLPTTDYEIGAVDDRDVVPRAIEVDINNPSWDVFASLGLWLLSVATVLFLPVMIALPYILIRYKGLNNAAESITADPTFLVLTLIGLFTAHVLTFGAAWVIVTQWRRRPFWSALGWSFGPRWGFWQSAGLAISLFIVGGVLTKLIGHEPTDIDIFVNSTFAVRLLLALLAATSGPLVEEIVYRGVLYPTLQKRIGMGWSVVLVSFLFFLVHLYQYRSSLGDITVILVLSISLTLVRALTGRLLPCFIIHLVFNGIISILVVFQPYFEHIKQGPEPKTSFVMLWRMTRLITHTHGL